MATRPDPEPCREQDLGLFEITQRDGAARIGKLHTKHGMMTVFHYYHCNNYFWLISKKELEDRQADLRNKERELHDL